MKKWFSLFLICLITFITLTPKVGIFAYTENDYYEAIGSYMLGTMLISGDSTELDFSNGNGDSDFLLALGQALVTGDYTDLAEWGLNTLDETITDIKEFVHTSIYNISPDIYDYFYSNDNVKIELSAGHITKNLFSEISNTNNNITPEPGTDFSFISNVNYLYLNQYNILNIPYWTYDYGGQTATFLNPLSNYSLIRTNMSGNGFLDYRAPNNYVNFSFGVASILPKLTIYLNTNNDNSISVSYNNYEWTKIISEKGKKVSIYFPNQPETSNHALPQAVFTTNNDSFAYSMPSSFSSLTIAINWIYKFCYNIDLYVDGELWVKSNNDNSIPISLGNNLTIFNNNPASYYYSSPIYFDMTDLISKIKLAIQQKDILTYSDIEDLIYDVNGNLAIGTINFARTDYDILASEQIPYYPNFYYDNNLNQYVQAGANLINISTEVLPRDVLNILITSGVILLFGYVIRRLLE